MEEMEKYYLFITLFFTGATILMLEILGTRILAPFFGTTLFVWSSLISVAIIALAAGYFAGGFIADKKPRFSLLYIFIFAAAITILLISKGDALVLEATNGLGAQLGPLVASFILFSVPMFLLAMATPFAIKLKAEELNTIGATAGNLYGISTIGSFFGAILTGFFLIPSIGTEASLLLFAGILIAISAIHFLLQKKERKAFVLLLVLFIPAYTAPMPENMELLYKSESMYGQIKVVDGKIGENPEMRFMLLDGTTQTCMVKESNKSCIPYTSIVEAGLELRETRGKALLIGLGGGAITKVMEEKGMEFEAVEIDPEIVHVAKEYFGFKGKVTIADGRRFIKETEEKYTFIVIDAFGASNPPQHIFTKEMYEETEKALEEDGILIINSIGWDEGKEALFQKSIYKTLKEVFPFVSAHSTNPGDFGNVVFVASKQQLPIEENSLDVENAILLTDDYSPTESLALPSTERIRQDMKELFGGILTE